MHILQKSKSLLVGLAVLAMTLSSGLVHAVPIAAITSFTGGGNINTGGSDLPRTVGWSFAITNSIEVTSLGFWDDSLDGLVAAHDVGIWTDTGTLLSSTTILSGAGSALIGEFRYEAIAPLLLGPGSYVIGANIPINADNYRFNPSSVTTASDITFGNGIRSSANSGFAFPSLDANTGRIGPNFLFEAADVPEPSTLALLCVGLVAGSAVRRRTQN